MANNTHRLAFVRLGCALLLVLAGLWATGLTPLDAFGPPPDTPAARAPQLKELSAKAGRRITTVTIETSDPVAYLTNRPDPMTLLLDLREVDAARATATILPAKGLVAGGSVEQVTGDDGVRVARVRIKLTQPAAHQVRSRRNVIYVDLDSAFPLSSVGAASSGVVPALADPRIATLLENVRADATPTGASITLSGNGELVAQSVTPFGDGTPRVVLDFPNVRSKTPADVFVGRGPVSVVHVTTTGAVPATRVVVDLLRPASYRVIPPEDGEKNFTVLFEDTEPVEPVVKVPTPEAYVASLDPINSLLKRGFGAPAQAPQQGAVRSRATADAGNRDARAATFYWTSCHPRFSGS